MVYRSVNENTILGEKKMEQLEIKWKKPWVVCLTALVCCLLWGSAFPSIKIGYQLFEIGSQDTASQILFAGVRFALAGVLTVLIGSVMNKKILVPQKTSWTMILRLSLAQTVIQYFFFYIGLANTTGVKSSIINASNVFLALLISSVVFRMERLGAQKIAGCLVGFFGVVLINLDGTGLNGGMKLMGEGFIFCSALSYAISSVLIKKYSQKENPVILSGYQFTLGGVVMAVAGSVMGGQLHGFSAKAILLLVYMAMISAVAYSLWGILLKYNPVGKVAVYGFMNPVFGVILSALLLGEQNQAFTFRGLNSLIFVCVGIYIVNREKMQSE